MRLPLFVLCPVAAIASWQVAEAAIASSTADPSMAAASVVAVPTAVNHAIVPTTAIQQAIALPETIPSQVTHTPEQGSIDGLVTPEPSIATAPIKPESPINTPSETSVASRAVRMETPHDKNAIVLKPESIPQPLPNTTTSAKIETAASVQKETAIEASPLQRSVSQTAIDLLPPEHIAQVSPTDGLTEPGNNPIDVKPEPLDPQDTQTELGEIRILRRPAQQPTPRPQPDVQLLLRSGIFSSSNISALETFHPSDVVFSNTGLLLVTPKLGPTTRLVASAGGGAIRFATEGDFNYNVLNFNVGIQQRLTSQMYAQLGWVNEQLYRDGNGQRLLLDNAVDFTIGRQDQLGKQLRLDSFYNLRASFANPTDQSRVANTLGARLRYDFTSHFQGALDYRLTFKNFTDVDRSDTEHQISATATYSFNPNLFVAGSVSYLFGNSSNSAIDVNNVAIGVVIGMNLPFRF